MLTKLYLIGAKDHKRSEKEELAQIIHEAGLKVYLNKYGPHFNEKLAEKASAVMQNANGKEHSWTAADITGALAELGLHLPEKATPGDITYAANMLYADFSKSGMPDINYIKGAVMLAEDPDGYEGQIFSRWLMDTHMKKKHIDFYDFI